MGVNSSRIHKKVPKVTFRDIERTGRGPSFLFQDGRRVSVVGYQCVRKDKCYYYYKDIKQN